MSNPFDGDARGLPASVPRGVAAFVPEETAVPVRHAIGYDDFVLLVGRANAINWSAEATLTAIAIRGDELLESHPAFLRSAAIFLGNRRGSGHLGDVGSGASG